MSISERGVDLVMRFESCRVAVYRDPGGLPTAGSGTWLPAMTTTGSAKNSPRPKSASCSSRT